MNIKMNPYQDIVDITIEDDKTIVDFLFYDNYSHWWTIDFWLYNCFITENIITDNNSLLNKIFYLFKNTSQFHILYNIINIVMFYIFNNFSIKSSIKSFVKGNVISDDVIVYNLMSHEWRYENSSNFKNIYNGDIIDNIPSNVKVISLYNPSMFSFLEEYYIYKEIESYSDKSQNPCIYWKYWSWNVVRDEIKSYRYFNNVWKKLSEHNEWFDKWGFVTGMSSDIIKKIMKNRILGSIPLEVGKFSIFENMIKKEKPSAIIMLDEQMPTGRILVSAARKHGVKTVGIQHGVIANHRAYLYHDTSNVSVSGKEIGKSFPIPDVTCVWGELEYDVLVNKAGYSADQVVVTGNPRYDHLGRASNTYSRDEFCNRYNINHGNKIILWVTQCDGMDIEEIKAYFKEVFYALSDSLNVTLIIKQHPNDKPIYRKIIDKFIQEYNSNLNIQIIVPNKLSNTTEMVYICDIVINKNSTTGQEAIAFHKPMIILDFSKEFPPYDIDYAEYVKEGVGIPVYNRGELKQAITDIIDNGSDIKAAQDKYIKKHMYKIDGLASKRVADVIMRCIKS